MKPPHYRSLYEHSYLLTKNPFGTDIPYGESWGIFLGSGFHNSGIAYAVRIDSIVEIGDINPGVSAMRLLAHEGKPETEVREGDIIVREDLPRLIWRSSETTGGSFTFTPLDYAKRLIVGSWPVTHQVIESAADPRYDGKITRLDPFRDWTRWDKNFFVDRHDKTITLPFKTVVHLDKRLFAGTDEEHPPASIKFTTVFEGDDLDTSSNGLTIRRENGEIIPVNEGDTIQAADFGNLYWDTRSNAGGSLEFVPQDQDGNGIVNIYRHYIEVFIRLTEADPPTTTGDVNAPVVGHNQVNMIDPAVFHHVLPRPTGSTPLILKVLAYTENLEDGRTLYLYTLSGKGTTAYELVRVDAPVSQEEALLRAQAAGGTLLSIDDAMEREWLDEYFFKAQGLTSDDAMHAQNTASTLSAFVIERASHHNPLLIYAEGQHWESVTSYSSGFEHRYLERMGWDSTHNTGGNIVIGQMSSARNDATIMPETIRTIRLTEAPAPAPADPSSDESSDDDKTAVTGKHLDKSAGIVLTAEMLTEGPTASGTPAGATTDTGTPVSGNTPPDRHALTMPSLMDSTLLQDGRQEPPLI